MKNFSTLTIQHWGTHLKWLNSDRSLHSQFSLSRSSSTIALFFAVVLLLYNISASPLSHKRPTSSARRETWVVFFGGKVENLLFIVISLLGERNVLVALLKYSHYSSFLCVSVLFHIEITRVCLVIRRESPKFKSACVTHPEEKI